MLSRRRWTVAPRRPRASCPGHGAMSCLDPKPFAKLAQLFPSSKRSPLDVELPAEPPLHRIGRDLEACGDFLKGKAELSGTRQSPSPTLLCLELVLLTVEVDPSPSDYAPDVFRSGSRGKRPLLTGHDQEMAPLSVLVLQLNPGLPSAGVASDSNSLHVDRPTPKGKYPPGRFRSLASPERPVRRVVFCVS